MSKGAISFSKDNEYYTPLEVYKRFGPFNYDPATTEEKAKEMGVSEFDTIETDGLKRDWTKYKKIWINPPFTIKHLFFEKACQTYKATHNDIYFLCPIEFLTTKRFHNSISGGGIRLYLPNGRIKFQSGLGKDSKAPAFGSVIIKIQDKNEIEFIEI